MVPKIAHELGDKAKTDLARWESYPRIQRSIKALKAHDERVFGAILVVVVVFLTLWLRYCAPAPEHADSPQMIQYNMTVPGSDATTPSGSSGEDRKKTPQNATKKKNTVDTGTVSAILAELDSLLGAFDDEETEKIEYRLAVLTTMFLNAKLASRGRMARLKFHAVIEVITIDLPGRTALSEDMKMFEDLINSYGDEPSDAEIVEAKEILERVIGALKATLQKAAGSPQLNLELNQ